MPVFARNTIVVPVQPTVSAKCARSIIGFRTLLPISTIIGASEDAEYPFGNCKDYRDNTQYSPVSTSQVIIEFRQISFSLIDYVGIAIHNGATVGLSGFLEAQILGVWVKVCDISSTFDNKTIMQYFDPVNANRQRLTLNYSGKLYIGTIYLGKSWEMERTPDLGYTPPDTNSLDEAQQFYADAAQFVIGRRVEKGYGTKGKFSNISFNILNTEYVQYMEHVKSSRPLFFKWNSDLDSNFYGQQNPNRLTAPRYDKFNRGTLTFDLEGRN